MAQSEIVHLDVQQLLEDHHDRMQTVYSTVDGQTRLFVERL